MGRWRGISSGFLAPSELMASEVREELREVPRLAQPLAGAPPSAPSAAPPPSIDIRWRWRLCRELPALPRREEQRLSAAAARGEVSPSPLGPHAPGRPLSTSMAMERWETCAGGSNPRLSPAARPAAFSASYPKPWYPT